MDRSQFFTSRKQHRQAYTPTPIQKKVGTVPITCRHTTAAVSETSAGQKNPRHSTASPRSAPRNLLTLPVAAAAATASSTSPPLRARMPYRSRAASRHGLPRKGRCSSSASDSTVSESAACRLPRTVIAAGVPSLYSNWSVTMSYVLGVPPASPSAASACDVDTTST